MIDRLTEKHMPKILAYRRHLHQYPELSFEEFETSEYIAGELTEMGYDVRRKIGGTGLVALLDTGRPGPAIAFRADMDALPLLEETGLPYESKRVGVMHACGHDGHMAVLLGAALGLMELRQELSGTIKLIFQPGEEANGGAKCMINEGALKNPDCEGIFALHMMPDLPTGTIGIKAGYLSATDDEFYIKVHGIGAHSSEPETGVNAIVIASQIVSSLMTILGSNVSPFDVATFSICKISGGDAVNIIPEEVEMGGMIRCIEMKNKLVIREKMKNIVENTAKGLGGRGEIEFIEGFPPVNNDGPLTQKVKEAGGKSLAGPEDVVVIQRPHMGSEDFAYYQQEIPGAMFVLGCRHPQGETGSLHSAHLNIDEDSLEYGVKVYLNLALDICGRHKGNPPD